MSCGQLHFLGQTLSRLPNNYPDIEGTVNFQMTTCVFSPTGRVRENICFPFWLHFVIFDQTLIS